MCLLTDPVEDCAKSSKLYNLFVGIMSHFLHMFVNPQPVFGFPTYPTFTVSLTGLCEPNCQFICYEPIRRLFGGLFNLKKQKGNKWAIYFKTTKNKKETNAYFKLLFCRHYQHIQKCMVGFSLKRCSQVSVVDSFPVCWLECIFICSEQTCWSGSALSAKKHQ